MKHAYLILAHNEFALLEFLLTCLDDERNDIFIHIDKKVTNFPVVQLKNTTVHYLTDRIPVYWGDFSIVEAELLLFQEALKHGDYGHLHLLSGVDMPLKSQNAIHDFFNQHTGKEFIGFSQYDYTTEVARKVKRFHLFSKQFKSQNLVIKSIRAVYIRVQEFLGLFRNSDIQFKKGTQWVSITPEFAAYVLSRKNDIYKIFQHTFCSDEIFLQTLCWNSNFRHHIFNTTNEAEGSQRKIGWKNGQLVDWGNKDYDQVISSPFLFARKFNLNNLDIIINIQRFVEK